MTPNQTPLSWQVLNAERFETVSMVVPEMDPPFSPLPSFLPTVLPLERIGPVWGTNYTLFTANYTPPLNGKGFAQPYDLVAAGLNLTITSEYNRFTTSQMCPDYIWGGQRPT